MYWQEGVLLGGFFSKLGRNSEWWWNNKIRMIKQDEIIMSLGIVIRTEVKGTGLGYILKVSLIWWYLFGCLVWEERRKERKKGREKKGREGNEGKGKGRE